jgi:hypothetical protein
MGSDIEVHKRSGCPMCKVSFGDYLMPSSPEGIEALKDYKVHQPLRNRITTIKGEKLRSLSQMNLYWAACTLVADNIDDSDPKFKRWKTKEAVDFKIRVALDFTDKNLLAVKPDGEVVFKYRSIAIRNLKHIEACNYFSQAFELMAHILKMTKDDFIRAVKSKMLSYWS